MEQLKVEISFTAVKRLVDVVDVVVVVVVDVYEFLLFLWLALKLHSCQQTFSSRSYLC